MTATAITTRRRLKTLRSLAATSGREQSLMAIAQLTAGIGNLAFTLVCVRLLAPHEYSRLASFLAAYLLLYLPFSALSAGAAAHPQSALGHRRHAAVGGLVLGAVIVAAGLSGLGRLLDLQGGIVLTLGLAAPIAGPLAIERGRALGQGRHRAMAGSLLAEPVLRLAFGAPAAALLGATGATGAVVLAGYAAWGVALAGSGPAGGSVRRRLTRTGRPDTVDGDGTRPGVMAVTAGFLLLAVLQNQDVVWANARLGAAQASRFAVLSTIGGIAVFASTTVPLVLLARGRRADRGALGTAMLVAAALGGFALVPAAIDGRALVGAVFGERYASVAPLLVPYLIAMALLGVSRVLVADRCARAPSRTVIALLAGCAILQAALIATLGTDAAAVSHATVAASLALTLGLLITSPGAVTALTAVRRRRADGSWTAVSQPARPVADLSGAEAIAAAVAPGTEAPTLPVPLDFAPEAAPQSRVPLPLRRPSRRVVALGAVTVIGAALRLIAGRSLWLDEATSITQARMSFPGMLHNLQTTDVQPPLHDAILWVLDHAFGDSAAVMRSPSLVTGTLLIPAVYALARDLWSERTGLIAAVLTALAPFLIWYSQEARMYALFMLLATLSLWAQVRILRDPEDAGRWWWLHRVCTAALMWTQYFGLLLIIVQQAGFVVAVSRAPHRRSLLVGWLFTLAVVAAALVPLVPFAVHQYHANQASGKGFGATPSQTGSAIEAGHTTPTVYAVLTNVVWGVWGYHSATTMAALTALWPLLMLLLLVLLGRGRSWRVAYLLAFAFVPVAILFAVGQVKPFLFEIRYFCGAVPIAMVLLARLCERAGRHRSGILALTGVLAVSFVVAFVDQQYSQANPRIYDFQGSLATISHQMRPGDVLLYEPYYLKDLVHYYAPGVRSRPLVRDPQRLATGHEIFVLASFQEQSANARAVDAALLKLREHRRQVEAFKRPEVQVWAFR